MAACPPLGRRPYGSGGNTLCVELRCGPHLLLLDAGSGAREFGRELAASGVPVDADILLSHTHLDHICGLPFFAPMFNSATRLRFWGGHLAPPDGIAAALARSWRAPLMPDLDAAFRATLSFTNFTPGDTLEPHAGLRVGTVALRHPGNSIGYRFEWGGASLCYITDTEHPPQGLDQRLLRFVTGSDVMIYDASFTEDEYLSRVGWGHSTWRAAADLADAAGVGQLGTVPPRPRSRRPDDGYDRAGDRGATPRIVDGDGRDAARGEGQPGLTRNA